MRYLLSIAALSAVLSIGCGGASLSPWQVAGTTVSGVSAAWDVAAPQIPEGHEETVSAISSALDEAPGMLEAWQEVGEAPHEWKPWTVALFDTFEALVTALDAGGQNMPSWLLPVSAGLKMLINMLGV